MNKVKLVSVVTLILILSNFLVYQYVLGASGSATYVVSPLGFVKPSSYIIEQIGSTYYAIDGTYGTELTSGTDATTVINYALSNGLTSGRTWKETVVCKGEFIIDQALTIPSYTILKIFGKITLAEGVTDNIIEAVDANDFEIIGGEIDGQATLQADGDDREEQCGIYIIRGYDFSVHNIKVYNTVYSNIRIRESHDGEVVNNIFDTTTGGTDIVADGVSLRGLETDITCNILIAHNTIRNCNHDNIEISAYCREIRIVENDSRNTTDHGILAHDTGTSWNIDIIGNIVQDTDQPAITLNTPYSNVKGNIISNTTWGIEVSGNFINVEGNFLETVVGPAIRIAGDYNTIINNMIYNCTQRGITVVGNEYNLIANNYLLENSWEGIRIDGDSDSNIIRENICINNTSNGIHIVAGTCNDNIVIDNYLSGNTPNNLVDVGTDTVIKRNVGFVTENSGTATNLANGGTIAHGLAGKPDVVTLTCLNATYDGEFVFVYWDEPNTDSTNISIDIYWANGTAISDSVIDISWDVVYEP